MLFCRHARILVQLQQDGRLTRCQQWSLHTHLFLCRRCRTFALQLALIQSALRTGSRPDPRRRQGASLP